MKPLRMISGVSLLFTGVMWGRVVEWITGYSDIMGWFTVTSLLAFMGGVFFWSGVTDRRKVV